MNAWVAATRAEVGLTVAVVADGANNLWLIGIVRTLTGERRHVALESALAVHTVRTLTAVKRALAFSLRADSVDADLVVLAVRGPNAGKALDALVFLAVHLDSVLERILSAVATCVAASVKRDAPPVLTDGLALTLR